MIEKKLLRLLAKRARKNSVHLRLTTTAKDGTPIEYDLVLAVGDTLDLKFSAEVNTECSKGIVYKHATLTVV